MSTLISTKDAAKVLNISEQRVRTLCRQGSLIAQQIGHHWIIEKESLSTYQLTAHQVAEDHTHYYSHSQKPVALSFFSGAMGLDLGIKRAGFDIRLACETDRYCRETIALNCPHIGLIGDIDQYSSQEIMQHAGLTSQDDVDLIIGGPPCQAFSTAGKRRGLNDHRGNVFLTYLDRIFAIRPKFFIIENVRGLLSCPMQHRPHHLRGAEYPDLAFDEYAGGALYFILNYIKQSGYTFSFNLYNTANFGTPQIRERVVIICSREGIRPPYLIPTHSESGLYGLQPWKTFREATQNITHHTHLKFPEKRLIYYRMLKAGENWRALPEQLQKEALGNAYYAGGGKSGFLRRLAWDKPAPTLVTHPAMPATDLAHPEENRPLSIEEYKRIQEFPEDWKIAGPLLQQYKQIGNAVPISFGVAIGSLIMQLLRNEIPTSMTDFPYSRYRGTDDYTWGAKFNNLWMKHQESQLSLL